MNPDPPPRRPPGALLLAAAALPAVVGLFLVRGMTYRSTVAWASTLPDPLQEAVAAFSDHGVVLLVVLFAAAALLARSRSTAALARGVAAGVGVVLAYLASETIKLLVTEERPCRTFPVPTIVACPPAGDWSWPSNHTTVAMAVAVAVLAMSVRLGLAALPVALLVGASRVVVGVHYLHDVAAGALLGAVLVVVCARWLTPWVSVLMEALRRRLPGAGRVLLGEVGR